MFGSLRVQVLTQPDEGEGSEAQGRHREVGSEGGVEQRYGPMLQEPDPRPTASDQSAPDDDRQGSTHWTAGCGTRTSWWCGRGEQATAPAMPIFRASSVCARS